MNIVPTSGETNTESIENAKQLLQQLGFSLMQTDNVVPTSGNTNIERVENAKQLLQQLGFSLMQTDNVVPTSGNTNIESVENANQLLQQLGFSLMQTDVATHDVSGSSSTLSDMEWLEYPMDFDTLDESGTDTDVTIHAESDSFLYDDPPEVPGVYGPDKNDGTVNLSRSSSTYSQLSWNEMFMDFNCLKDVEDSMDNYPNGVSPPYSLDDEMETTTKGQGILQESNDPMLSITIDMNGWN